MWRDLLMYVVLPLWLLGGVADWWCHRRSFTGAGRGRRALAFHLTLFAQVGLGGLVAMWLEINIAVLMLLLGLFLLHEVTTWMELRWQAGHRETRGGGQQMVHSFLELLPLFAWLLLLMGLQRTMGGAGAWSAPDEWQFRWKDDPLPLGYVLVAMAVFAGFNFGTLAQGAWRARYRLSPR